MKIIITFASCFLINFLVFKGAVFAEEIATRKGVDPAQNAKVTSALARNRVLRASDGGTGNSELTIEKKNDNGFRRKNCSTSIGNINTGDMRAGGRTPKENIVIIKGVVVNEC
ncbi:hypothetical protein [Chromobacterium sp. Rain0013]|nr:hypothetical protein [Chromobacterium sp. Rain0013]